MNRRQKIIVSITGIFIVLLALVGLTYAYFLTRITGNENDKSIEVTTANLSVTYNDDMDGDGEPDALMVFENIMPSNTEAYTKTFKVENTGNAKASYSVILDNMVNDFDRNQDLKYTLTRTGETNPVAEGNLVVGTKQILIPKVEIENEGVHTYTLTIKYIEAGVDQSIDMRKVLSFRVNIDEATITWDTAEEGTLLYALKNNQPNGTETTIPGQEASTINEKRLVTTEDDYGTSYVYRGNVENNYVTYSNMCWRIVRVQGDGSIKLTLADWQHPCGEANGYNSNDEDSAFIADSNGNARTNFAYNSSPNVPNTDSDFYLENSDIPIILSTWANDNNLNTSVLADSDWCVDTSVTNRIYDNEYDNKLINYAARERVGYGASILIPTLKCNMKGLNNTKASRYTNALGILSADEVSFSGSMYVGLFSEESNRVYLTNNAQKNYLLSTPYYRYPLSYDSDNILGFGVRKNGSIGITNFNYQEYAVRPSVILKSNVLLSTNTEYIQDGTIDKPYVIK